VFVNPAMLEHGDARYQGTSITHAFAPACRKAGIVHMTFHDQWHTSMTNARRVGIDYFRVMAITGHKTMAVGKRYNTVDEQDLRQAMQQMDTAVNPEMERVTQILAQRAEPT